MFGKILWLSPESQAGKNPIDVWGEYIRERGNWELVNEWNEDVDIIFFGSDSVLDDDLLSKDAFKICYFWDFLPYRMLNLEFRTWALNQVDRMKKCNLVLAPSQVVINQTLTLGMSTALCTPGIDSYSIDHVQDQEKKHQICAVNRLVDHKQPGWIIIAASLITPPPKVIIVGSGNPQKLLDIADARGVECDVGPLSDEDKIKTIKESMCLVTASLWEGFGMSAIEAMYCGTPVLAFDTPIHREILKEYALYFNGPMDLASKIVDLLNNRELVVKLGTIGRDYVGTNFTFEKATDRLEEFLNHVIKQIAGKKIRENSSRNNWKRLYDQEAVRNKTYNAYRYDVKWNRYWEPKYFLELFEKYDIKEVLDIGCGFIHPVIFALGSVKVKAFDVSSVVIEQGKELAEKENVSHLIEWRQGFGEKLPYAEGNLNCVLMSEILEHVPDPGQLIKEGFRVLKPGGYLITGVPLERHYYDPMHLNIFTSDSMKKLLMEFPDLKIIESDIIAEPGTEPSVILNVSQKVV